MRPLLSALVLLLLVTACAAGPQQPITVPGTHVSITPPSGWVASDLYSGFEDKGSGAVIVVSDMDGAPYSKTSVGFTKEEMAKRGMELLSKTTATFGSHSGMCLAARQTADDETYSKWIVCFGDESRSVVIVATVKQALQSQVKDAVIASLMTARIEAGATVDPFAGLLFVVQAKEPYRLAKRISSTLVFTHKGEFPATSPTAPLFVVSSSLGLPTVADQETFAKTRAKQTDSLADINIYETGKMALDGLTGVQLMATATDTKTETPMLLYQVILFDKNAYYILQGIAEQKAQTEAQLWFDMVKSFKHKTSSSATP